MKETLDELLAVMLDEITFIIIITFFFFANSARNAQQTIRRFCFFVTNECHIYIRVFLFLFYFSISNWLFFFLIGNFKNPCDTNQIIGIKMYY